MGALGWRYNGIDDRCRLSGLHREPSVTRGLESAVIALWSFHAKWLRKRRAEIVASARFRHKTHGGVRHDVHILGVSYVVGASCEAGGLAGLSAPDVDGYEDNYPRLPRRLAQEARPAGVWPGGTEFGAAGVTHALALVN